VGAGGDRATGGAGTLACDEAEADAGARGAADTAFGARGAAAAAFSAAGSIAATSDERAGVAAACWPPDRRTSAAVVAVTARAAPAARTKGQRRGARGGFSGGLEIDVPGKVCSWLATPLGVELICDARPQARSSSRPSSLAVAKR
jgi:hypothetical protein